MVNIFFTADSHFGHENIIKYCCRPFKSLEQMNKNLIHNWNQRVKPEDVVYFLGDFCFKNSKNGKKGEGMTENYNFWLSQLNGNVIFLKGNHDRRNSLNTKLKSCVIEIGGGLVYLCHNPIDYNKDCKINLVGHVHEKWKIKRENGVILVNVGVDQWNFRPVTWEEILKVIRQFLKEE